MMNAGTVPETRRYQVACRVKDCGAKWIGSFESRDMHCAGARSLAKNERCPRCKSRRFRYGGIGGDYAKRLDATPDMISDRDYSAPLSKLMLVDRWRFTPISWKPKRDGSTTKCGSRCRAAKGPACDCECRGENHGSLFGAL